MKRFLLLTVLFLAFLTAGYNYLGFSRLVKDYPGSYPIDLRLRWIEHRFLWEGRNPQLEGHPGLPDSHANMRNQGGSYPPWAYSIGSLFVPPIPFDGVRLYYALVCAAALTALAAWAYPQAGALGGFGVLAIFPAAVCVSYGQYGVVIAGLVAAAQSLIRKRHDVAAGVLLGLALLKPQLAALFVLVALLYGHVRTVIGAAVTVAVATLVASRMAHSAPWTMFSRFGGEAELYYWLSHNPLLPWLVPSLGFRLATIVLGFTGIAAMLVLWWRQGPNRNIVHSFAIAAIITMFWSYRRHYDTVLMALALAPALALGLKAGRARLALALLVGVTLWLPIRDAQWEWLSVKVADLALWIVLAWAFVDADRKGTLSTEPASSLSRSG